MNNQIDCVILAGGLGTRLRSVLPDGMPKCLADINGWPFIDILVENLQAADFRHFVFCLGYGSDKIAKHLCESWKGKSHNFSFSYERESLGTGGALKIAHERNIEDEWLVGNWEMFFVFNGDTIAEVDFNLMLESHKSKDWLATVAYDYNKQCNAGVYILSRRIFKLMEKFYPPFSLDEVLGSRSEAAEMVNWYPVERFWDIGTPEGLEELRRIMVDYSSVQRAPGEPGGRRLVTG